jgi:DNA repair photolyase
MAERNLVEVFLSITTLDHALARRMEPRAAAPKRRLETLRRLSSAEIPTGVMFAPVIPMLNDSEMERVLEAASSAGARFAGYVIVRLPHEIKDLFKQWLADHEPAKAGHVMNRIRDLRGGKENDHRFGSRMTGTGIYAALIHRRFELACKRLGLNRSKHTLDITQFRSPESNSGQVSLF